MTTKELEQLDSVLRVLDRADALLDELQRAVDAMYAEAVEESEAH